MVAQHEQLLARAQVVVSLTLPRALRLANYPCLVTAARALISKGTPRLLLGAIDAGTQWKPSSCRNSPALCIVRCSFHCSGTSIESAPLHPYSLHQPWTSFR